MNVLLDAAISFSGHFHSSYSKWNLLKFFAHICAFKFYLTTKMPAASIKKLQICWLVRRWNSKTADEIANKTPWISKNLEPALHCHPQIYIWWIIYIFEHKNMTDLKTNPWRIGKKLRLLLLFLTITKIQILSGQTNQGNSIHLKYIFHEFYKNMLNLLI